MCKQRRAIRALTSTATIWALTSALFTSAVQASVATVRFVSTSGQDSGDCTSNPCRTVGYAVSQSSAGDTIEVGTGTYSELVSIDRSVAIEGAGAGSTIIDAAAAGRAVTIGSPSASLTVRLTDLTVRNGSARQGGGVGSVPGPGLSNYVVLRGVLVSANQAVGAPDGLGGGVFNGAGSAMRIRASGVESNTAIGRSGGSGFGGGIYNAGTLSIDTSTLSGNDAVGGPAVVQNGKGGTGACGGLDSPGPITVMRSTVSGNVAEGGHGADFCTFPYGGLGGDALGGGMVVGSDLTLANSTVAANTAQGGRGGQALPNPHCHGRGGAGGMAQGGGLVAGSAQTLINDTIAMSQALGGRGGCGDRGCGAQGAAVGGGVHIGTGEVGATNTVLAQNRAAFGPNCDGIAFSGGHNLLGTKRGCKGFDAQGDQVRQDPLLGPLQDNGGPTFTMALGQGSPAIDAGDDSICAAPPIGGLDQRGQPRPGGPHCDVGAFEVEPG